MNRRRGHGGEEVGVTHGGRSNSDRTANAFIECELGLI